MQPHRSFWSCAFGLPCTDADLREVPSEALRALLRTSVTWCQCRWDYSRVSGSKWNKKHQNKIGWDPLQPALVAGNPVRGTGIGTRLCLRSNLCHSMMINLVTTGASRATECSHFLAICFTWSLSFPECGTLGVELKTPSCLSHCKDCGCAEDIDVHLIQCIVGGEVFPGVILIKGDLK